MLFITVAASLVYHKNNKIIEHIFSFFAEPWMQRCHAHISNISDFMHVIIFTTNFYPFLHFHSL